MIPEKTQSPIRYPSVPYWWRVGNSPACFWWDRTLYHWTPTNDRSSRNPECDFFIWI